MIRNHDSAGWPRTPQNHVASALPRKDKAHALQRFA